MTSEKEHDIEVSESTVSTRHFYSNRLKIEIQNMKESIIQMENSKSSLKTSSFGAEFIQNKLSSLCNMIVLRESSIKEMEVKITDIESGKFDQEYNDDQIKLSTDLQQKREEKISRVIKEKTDKNESIQKMYNLNNVEKRSIASEHEMKKSLTYFYNVCDTLPKYMSDKLDNMPGNKGHIWRGVHCYGKLPDTSNTVTMFETKTGVQYIHEWKNENNKSLYIVYQKLTRESQKVEISRKYK